MKLLLFVDYLHVANKQLLFFCAPDLSQRGEANFKYTDLTREDTGTNIKYYTHIADFYHSGNLTNCLKEAHLESETVVVSKMRFPEGQIGILAGGFGPSALVEKA